MTKGQVAAGKTQWPTATGAVCRSYMGGTRRHAWPKLPTLSPRRRGAWSPRSFLQGWRVLEPSAVVMPLGPIARKAEEWGRARGSMDEWWAWQDQQRVAMSRPLIWIGTHRERTTSISICVRGGLPPIATVCVVGTVGVAAALCALPTDHRQLIYGPSPRRGRSALCRSGGGAGAEREAGVAAAGARPLAEVWAGPPATGRVRRRRSRRDRCRGVARSSHTNPGGVSMGRQREAGWRRPVLLAVRARRCCRWHHRSHGWTVPCDEH